MINAMEETIQKSILLSVPEAAKELFGSSSEGNRARVRKAIKEGSIPVKQIGKRSFIARSTITEFSSVGSAWRD